MASLPLGLLLFLAGPIPAPDARPQSPAQEFEFSDKPCTECCTSLLVGREASEDGSTMTSHSCDSGTDRTWIKLEPRKTHEPGS
ncbi:MAG: C69 family dipeptidase, partial [Gemmatimonadetes bacterium]|nr:C69 family dipeptidase [Gemmatimonadota bacterium]